MAKMYSEKAAFKDPSLGTGVVEQSRAQIAKKYGELEAIFSGRPRLDCTNLSL